MSLCYQHNKASQTEILRHLQCVSTAFVQDLSQRVNLEEYSQKLFSLAEREEAWFEDELIGLVAYYINNDTQHTFITNVSVDVNYQNQGIATELLNNTIEFSKRKSINLISLEVADDDKLLRFYTKQGFCYRNNDNANELTMYLAPLVVIRCTVFNHEPYLRDCLDGFVMQQTNFPFVAVVHDDASTDNSAAIIREYADKYPDIIKPMFESENQYSKGNGTLTRIMNTAIAATGAKYIAMCEGDDYWNDPLKLQKQVDYMEENPECSLCFHKVNTLIQETGEIKEEFIVRDVPSKSNVIDLAKGNYIHTPSVLFRRSFLDLERYYKMMPCLPGDYVMWMLLAEKGFICKIDEPMAVYRHGSGIWSNNGGNNQSLQVLKTLSKLSCIIENSEARAILNANVLKLSTDMLDYISNVEKQYNQIRSSKAYKLGKFLLKPLKMLKR